MISQRGKSNRCFCQRPCKNNHPPLSEQRRIVDILDRFDTLTNSISEGLPREIALRRKQYEYYRDALLNFPQPTPTA